MLAYIPELIPYISTTLLIAVSASAIGFILGTTCAFAQEKGPFYLGWIITIYITIIRGTPMIIQIPFWYYMLPELGIEISAIMTAIMAIGLNSGAYISQIVRTGITSVSTGQLEAAQVIGLSRIQTMRYIIFPQAIRIVIPALLNECITLIKDSSLASVLPGVVELFKKSSMIISHTYDALGVYAAVAIIYLILTSFLSMFTHYLERKMAYRVTN